MQRRTAEFSPTLFALQEFLDECALLSERAHLLLTVLSFQVELFITSFRYRQLCECGMSYIFPFLPAEEYRDFNSIPISAASFIHPKYGENEWKGIHSLSFLL